MVGVLDEGAVPVGTDSLDDDEQPVIAATAAPSAAIRKTFTKYGTWMASNRYTKCRSTSAISLR